MDIIEAFTSVTYWQLGGLLYLLVVGYVLYDIMGRKDFGNTHEKSIWILLLLITPVFGIILYFVKSNPRSRKRSFNSNFSKN